MFSFLPQEQKKSLVKEYKIRFWITIFITLFFVICIAIVAESPAYFFSSYKSEEVRTEVDKEKNKPEKKEQQKSLEELAHTNLYIKTLSADEGAPVSSSLDKLFKIKGKIIFSSFAIKRNPAGGATFAATGRAAKREDLVAFTKALKADPVFSEVTIPISGFTQTANIIFNFSLTGNF
ncbi:MAG: MFS transporter [bacterium]